jgi:hypothetical protein
VDDGESVQTLSAFSDLIGAMSDMLEYIGFLSVDLEGLESAAVKALLAEIGLADETLST